MEYNPERRELKLSKKNNELDTFVLDFVGLLKDYVVVSGYVSILTGRSRATEDIDLLIPSLNFEEFEEYWKKFEKAGFECLNTSKEKEAFDMLKDHAIRFARKGKPIPNMEFKVITNDVQKYSLNHKIKVILGHKEMFISPFEMQIAYKLFLGSEKDLEDAKHIYVLFKENLNNDELLNLLNKLNVTDKFQLIQ
ncbi:hypothetical protein COU60_02555 [Candidatus Pacearchaeota archaeon CG10_big_fil_rev_8_21_14_0_10_34_76]|nr:MAG: hypothetical protein COU60_02555 [Candidatus Pacearchaeota archaeon CG10_big_fil_rev_8_21_14_0_10_34_76]